MSWRPRLRELLRRATQRNAQSQLCTVYCEIAQNSQSLLCLLDYKRIQFLALWAVCCIAVYHKLLTWNVFLPLPTAPTPEVVHGKINKIDSQIFINMLYRHTFLILFQLWSMHCHDYSNCLPERECVCVLVRESIVWAHLLCLFSVFVNLRFIFLFSFAIHT